MRIARSAIAGLGALTLALAAAAGSLAQPRAETPPPARLAPGQPMPAAELAALVDGTVRQAMADRHIAGAAVSIVQDGSVVFARGYGFASLAPYRPVDPDRTLFRLGSISTVFTWILVHRQIEAGHMRLDAPVNLYLPDSLRIPDQGFGEPIRLRDLMDHRPGFEDRVLGQLIERDPARVRPLDVYLRQERPRRVRAPGAVVSYSNYGAGLAGAAAAEVSGKTVEALAESEITRPLGMDRTTFREPRPARAGLPAPMAPALAGDLSEGFRWTPTGFRVRPFEYIGQIAPAGSISSTASDMARLMVMMLDGGTAGGARIYGPATAAAFAAPQPTPDGVPAWRHGLISVPLSGGLEGVGQGGDTLSFHSRMTLVPALRLGIFVSTNTDTGGRLAEELGDQVVGHFYAPGGGPPATGSQALIEDRRAFEGTYLTNRRAWGGLEGLVDRLGGVARVGVTPQGWLLVHGPDGGVRRFAVDGPPADGRFRAGEGPARLIFQMEGGQAVRFFDPDGASAFDRLPGWRLPIVLAVLAAAVALASLALLGASLARFGRTVRETTSQRRAGLIQSTQSLLWLTAMGLFAAWAAKAGDPAAVLYGWPGITLRIASSCALLAAALSLVSLLLLPLVWRGGRRVESWTGWRKLRFTFVALLFLTFAGLLATWGALQPWSA